MNFKNALVIVVAAGVVISLCIFFARKISSTVRAEHIFNSRLDKVWSVWNDPEMMKRWWGPKGYTAPMIKNDFRVGGRYLLSMKSPKGDVFWNTGTYKEIVPNQRIVASLSFADENGKALPGSEVPIPGEWPDEVTITTEFSEVGRTTKVTITEVGIPLLIKIGAKMGWDQQFEKLDALLQGE